MKPTPRLATLTMLVTAGFLALSACAQRTPYAPASGPERPGYDDRQLDETHFRVTYRGSSRTSRETVENYLLYRAAELTLENGYTHFLMLGKDTERDTYYRATYSRFGGYGYYWHGFPDWHYGIAPYSPLTDRVVRYTAHAEIKLTNEPEAEEDARAFDAQSVLTELEPFVVRR